MFQCIYIFKIYARCVQIITSNSLIVIIIYYSTEEDHFSSYSRLLLKYFLSEGVMCGHSLFLASASEKGEELLQVYFIFQCALIQNIKNIKNIIRTILYM